MDEITSAQDEMRTPSAFSRRAVVRTAAWSVPMVSVVVATPAFAASGTTLLVTGSADTFRCNSGAQFTAGTPADGTYAVGVRVDLTVMNGPLSNLTATLANRSAAPNGFTIFNSVAGKQGGTTWKANQGSLADDGWTVTPAPSNTQASPFMFVQGSTTFTTGSLRFVIGGFSASGANSDFPATLTFASTDLPTSVTVNITTSTTSPFAAVG